MLATTRRRASGIPTKSRTAADDEGERLRPGTSAAARRAPSEAVVGAGHRRRSAGRRAPRPGRRSCRARPGRRGPVRRPRAARPPGTGPGGPAGAAGTPARRRRRPRPRRAVRQATRAPALRPPTHERAGTRQRDGLRHGREPGLVELRRRRRHPLARPPATAARRARRRSPPRGSSRASAARSRASIPPPAPWPRTSERRRSRVARARSADSRASPTRRGRRRRSHSSRHHGSRGSRQGSISSGRCSHVVDRRRHRIRLEQPGRGRHQQRPRRVDVVCRRGRATPTTLRARPSAASGRGSARRRRRPRSSARCTVHSQASGSSSVPVRVAPELVEAGHRERAAVGRVDEVRLLRLPLACSVGYHS